MAESFFGTAAQARRFWTCTNLYLRPARRRRQIRLAQRIRRHTPRRIALPVSPLMSQLRGDLTAMGELIEKAVDTALMALIDRSGSLADGVIADDVEIDELENIIDRTCQEVLRHESTPPDDFRFVIASMKICVDLERMGDQAVDIASSVGFLVTRRSILHDFTTITHIIETTQQMVRDSVSCLISRNSELAWSVCVVDDIVDAEAQRLHDYLVSLGQDEPQKVERVVQLLYVVRALERIADQATNIAEEVIYMLEGKMVRHHIDEYRQQHEIEIQATPARGGKTAKKTGKAGKKAGKKKAGKKKN
jgi:phosphate transport system protein